MITSNIEEFHSVMRKWLANTEKALPEAINSRMFYVLLRVFIMIPPHDAAAERAKIRAYLSEPVNTTYKHAGYGKNKKGFPVTRGGLILQYRRKKLGEPNLRGEEFARAQKKFQSINVGAAGYLKSALVKAMKQINGHFTQTGGQKKRVGAKGEKTSPNAALAQISAEYGINIVGNIGAMKGSKASIRAAIAGFSPSSSVETTTKIRDDQMGKVEAIYNTAAARAMADEMAAMQAHLTEQVEQAAEEALSAQR